MVSRLWQSPLAGAALMTLLMAAVALSASFALHRGAGLSQAIGEDLASADTLLGGGERACRVVGRRGCQAGGLPCNKPLQVIPHRVALYGEQLYDAPATRGDNGGESLSRVKHEVSSIDALVLKFALGPPETNICASQHALAPLCLIFNGESPLCQRGNLHG